MCTQIFIGGYEATHQEEATYCYNGESSTLHQGFFLLQVLHRKGVVRFDKKNNMFWNQIATCHIHISHDHVHSNAALKPLNQIGPYGIVEPDQRELLNSP